MICSECGFSYVPDIPEDVKLHENYHDEMVKGVPLSTTKEMEVIWEDRGSLIFVVNFSSPFPQKKIAEKVGIIANRDTPYDISPYSAGEIRDDRDVHIFLYHKENRIIGYLLIEKRTNIWKCSWEQYEKQQPSVVSDIPFLWTVGLVWVHRGHRHKGIAMTLIKEASNYFKLKLKDFGWYAPPITESGEAMLRKILPEGYFIAK